MKDLGQLDDEEARLRLGENVLRLRAVPSGTIINLRTTAEQKCRAVPSRARIEGSWILVSLKSRLESNNEEEEDTVKNLGQLGDEEAPLKTRANHWIKATLSKSAKSNRIHYMYM